MNVIYLIPVCYRLAEVGVLETPKLQGKYDTGQVGWLIEFLNAFSLLYYVL